MKKGLLIVYSGPSGVGKGTILKEVFKDESLKLVYSVSMTTRSPREGEVDGVNYFFVDELYFKEKIAQGAFLEHAVFVGNYYGTPVEFVEKEREKGNNVILEIEVQGAKQVMERVDDYLSIFIVPPSLEELEKRIRGRKSESDEVIAQRIAKAEVELQETHLYDYVVCNDKVEEAAEQIKEIIRKEMTKQFETEFYN